MSIWPPEREEVYEVQRRLAPNPLADVAVGKVSRSPAGRAGFIRCDWFAPQAISNFIAHK